MNLPFEKVEREVVVKHKGQTDPLKGKKPGFETVEELLSRGIMILDKPPGPTSHMAVDYLKKVLKIQKAGHSGTLDPGVTGVLPLALGKATRITHSLLTAGKEYVCLMHLHKDVPEQELSQVLDKFRGEITQLPPKKSAVKRQNRKRTIYYLEVIERQGQDVLFLVGCQAGTYIRKLVHDIGLELGCGAHMTELRRTKAGPFKEDVCHTMQDIADAFHYYKKEGDPSLLRKMLFPIETGVSHLNKIWVHDGAVSTLCKGASLKSPGVSMFHSNIKPNEPVAIMTLKDELVMVGESKMNSKDIEFSSKGVVAIPKQVFMEPGTY